MKRCIVTYPGFKTYYRNKLVREQSAQSIEMWYYGPTQKKPQHVIVEDADGWVHVVNKDIVKLEKHDEET